MKLWPRTLGMQLIAVTAVAVFLSNVAVAIWFEMGSERLSESALTERVLDRAASMATLLSAIPPRARLAATQAMSTNVWRFELRRAEGESSGDHPHFLCVDCGEVSCLPSDSISIKQAAGAKESPIREVTEVLLKGRCGNCA